MCQEIGDISSNPLCCWVQCLPPHSGTSPERKPLQMQFSLFFPLRYSCRILSSCNTEKCITPFKAHNNPQESELPKSQPSAPQFQYPRCGSVHYTSTRCWWARKNPQFWWKSQKNWDRKCQLMGTPQRSEPKGSQESTRRVFREPSPWFSLEVTGRSPWKCEFVFQMLILNSQGNSSMLPTGFSPPPSLGSAGFSSG